jgi:IS30 family transposase
VRYARPFSLTGKKLPRLLRADEVLPCFEAGREGAVHSADIKQQIRLGLRQFSYDHGHENVPHEKVNAALGTESFFCEPYHSWEKGSVENSIGLIRRYYPDRSDLSLLTARAVSKLQDKLNNRPRKILGYSTPQEIFDAETRCA